MSTILEALKKSEQERKLNNVPTLADMPTPQESSNWLPALLVFIALLLLVLIGFVVQLVLFPPLTSDEGHSGNGGVHNAPVNEAQSVAGDDGVTGGNEELFSESDVVVNVVSYSSLPEKRFIMIAGKVVREGEFVRAGLKVEEIREKDVILNFRGKQITRRP